MFFHTMKASFMQQNPEQMSPAETPLKVTLQFHKFLTIVNDISVEKLSQNHPFHTNYLSKFFRHENEELIVSIYRFAESLRAKGFKESEIAICMNHWLSDEDSPILQLIDMWCPYAYYELAMVDNAHFFLICEIEKFTALVVSILREFYPSVEKQSTKTWLEFKLLNRISKNTFFKQVMKNYLAKFNKDKGHDAEFTKTQIFQSVAELEVLVNFPHIAEPFSRSIQHMVLFYKEHRLKKKVMILVKAVNEAKEEIKEYREEFKLGSTAVGSDQIFPVVNFVCERSGYNILAAVSYINAFLGHDLERRQKLLRKVSIEATYCLQLVEAVSGVYCHASQFLQSSRVP